MRKNIERILYFLVHSNIYLALGAASIAFMTLILLQLPFRWEPLFIASVSTFFLYNLNRRTDIKEDKVNYPERVEFVSRHINLLFGISLILYASGLILALLNSFLTFLITITSFVLVFIYSVFRLKKIFLLKDIVVALGWCLIVVLTVSYFDFSPVTFLIVLFIFSRVFVTTLVFDVKDLYGDRMYQINTFPVKYGINSTQKFVWIINLISLLFFSYIIFLFSLSKSFYFLLLLPIYSSIYTFFLDKNVKKILLYDMIVDGEYILLGIIGILVSLWM